MITCIYPRIFIKLGLCINIVEIGFGIAMGKFCKFLQLSACDTFRFSFTEDNLSEYQWIFTKLSTYIDIVEVCFGSANGQISSVFNRVIWQWQGIIVSRFYLTTEHIPWFMNEPYRAKTSKDGPENLKFQSFFFLFLCIYWLFPRITPFRIY